MTEIHPNFANEQMIEQQVRAWEVFDEDVLEVMQVVPRENFLPEKFAAFAYTDSSFLIHADFLLPAPSVQGKILQALDLNSDSTVLQIGVGSGYLSACIAELSKTITIVDQSEEKLAHIQACCDELNIKNFTPVTLKLENIFSDIENTYDAIVLQHALKSQPNSIKEALNINGVAVVFIGQAPIMQCVRIERIGESEWQEEVLFETKKYNDSSTRNYRHRICPIRILNTKDFVRCS